MKKLFCLSLAVLVAAAVAMAAVDVSGQWDMTRQTPRGEQTSTITFIQDGEKLTVKMPGRNGEEMTGTGTIKGSELEWTITRTGPQGEMTITYKAKVEGDKMTGTTQFGERTMDWTAVKKAK